MKKKHIKKAAKKILKAHEKNPLHYTYAEVQYAKIILDSLKKLKEAKS